MNDQIKKGITATFDDDTKRMHRFIIDEGQGIQGSIYIPKGSEVPDVVSIKLRTRANVEREKVNKQ
jgi:hypothetical protein